MRVAMKHDLFDVTSTFVAQFYKNQLTYWYDCMVCGHPVGDIGGHLEP